MKISFNRELVQIAWRGCRADALSSWAKPPIGQTAKLAMATCFALANSESAADYNCKPLCDRLTAQLTNAKRPLRPRENQWLQACQSPEVISDKVLESLDSYVATHGLEEKRRGDAPLDVDKAAGIKDAKLLELCTGASEPPPVTKPPTAKKAASK